MQLRRIIFDTSVIILFLFSFPKAYGFRNDICSRDSQSTCQKQPMNIYHQFEKHSNDNTGGNVDVRRERLLQIRDIRSVTHLNSRQNREHFGRAPNVDTRQNYDRIRVFRDSRDRQYLLDREIRFTNLNERQIFDRRFQSTERTPNNNQERNSRINIRTSDRRNININNDNRVRNSKLTYGGINSVRKARENLKYVPEQKRQISDRRELNNERNTERETEIRREHLSASRKSRFVKNTEDSAEFERRNRDQNIRIYNRNKRISSTDRNSRISGLLESPSDRRITNRLTVDNNERRQRSERKILPQIRQFEIRSLGNNNKRINSREQQNQVQESRYTTRNIRASRLSSEQLEYRKENLDRRLDSRERQNTIRNNSARLVYRTERNTERINEKIDPKKQLNRIRESREIIRNIRDTIIPLEESRYREDNSNRFVGRINIRTDSRERQNRVRDTRNTIRNNPARLEYRTEQNTEQRVDIRSLDSKKQLNRVRESRDTIRNIRDTIIPLQQSRYREDNSNRFAGRINERIDSRKQQNRVRESRNIIRNNPAGLQQNTEQRVDIRSLINERIDPKTQLNRVRESRYITRNIRDSRLSSEQLEYRKENSLLERNNERERQNRVRESRNTIRNNPASLGYRTEQNIEQRIDIRSLERINERINTKKQLNRARESRDTIGNIRETRIPLKQSGYRKDDFVGRINGRIDFREQQNRVRESRNIIRNSPVGLEQSTEQRVDIRSLVNERIDPTKQLNQVRESRYVTRNIRDTRLSSEQLEYRKENLLLERNNERERQNRVRESRNTIRNNPASLGYRTKQNIEQRIDIRSLERINERIDPKQQLNRVRESRDTIRNIRDTRIPLKQSGYRRDDFVGRINGRIDFREQQNRVRESRNIIRNSPVGLEQSTEERVDIRSLINERIDPKKQLNRVRESRYITRNIRDSKLSSEQLEYRKENSDRRLDSRERQNQVRESRNTIRNNPASLDYRTEQKTKQRVDIRPMNERIDHKKQLNRVRESRDTIRNIRDTIAPLEDNSNRFVGRINERIDSREQQNRIRESRDITRNIRDFADIRTENLKRSINRERLFDRTVPEERQRAVKTIEAIEIRDLKRLSLDNSARYIQNNPKRIIMSHASDQQDMSVFKLSYPKEKVQDFNEETNIWVNVVKMLLMCLLFLQISRNKTTDLKIFKCTRIPLFSQLFKQKVQ